MPLSPGSRLGWTRRCDTGSDTSFWVAWRSHSDRNHEEAVTLFEAHGDRGVVTSNYVRIVLGSFELVGSVVVV